MSPADDLLKISRHSAQAFLVAMSRAMQGDKRGPWILIGWLLAAHMFGMAMAAFCGGGCLNELGLRFHSDPGPSTLTLVSAIHKLAMTSQEASGWCL